LRDIFYLIERDVMTDPQHDSQDNARTRGGFSKASARSLEGETTGGRPSPNNSLTNDEGLGGCKESKS